MEKYVLTNFCYAFSGCRKWLQLVHVAQRERERQQLPTFSLPKSSVSSSLGVDSVQSIHRWWLSVRLSFRVID